MNSLYEMSGKYAELASMEDIDPDVLADTLESIQDAMEVKVDNIANWIDNNKTVIDGIKRRKDELTERLTRLENLNKRLKTYLVDSLDGAGIKKMNAGDHEVATRNFKQSVVIDDPGQLPVDYVREVPAKYEPDKKILYTALSEGKEITGAHLEANRGVIIK